MNQYKTQQMCESNYLKNVIAVKFTYNHFKTQEINGKALNRCPFMIKCCLNSCKACDMCKTLADIYPLVLRYVLDWFVTP